MTALGISQKEYLKKYLSGSGNDKKKKKKRQKSLKVAVNRLRVVDDDVDLQDMRPLKAEELEIYDLQEDAPQIVGIIDERPEEIKIREQFATKKWKVVADESDGGVKIIDKTHKVESIRHVECDLSRLRKHPGKDTDKLTQLKENDSSHAWNELENNNSISHSIEKGSSDCNSDILPHGKVKKSAVEQSSNGNYDDRNSMKRIISDPETSPCWKERGDIDSDSSPPRKTKNHYDESIFKSEEQESNSDASPPRRSKNFVSAESCADVLPLQENEREDRENLPRRHRRDSGSDLSLPRTGKEFPVKSNRRKYDSDESPLRHSRPKAYNSSSQRKYKVEDLAYKHGKGQRDDDVLLLRREKRRSSESPQKSNRGNERGQRASRWEDAEGTRHRRKEAERRISLSPLFELHSLCVKTQDQCFLSDSASTSVTAETKQDSTSRRSKEHARKLTMDDRRAGLVEASDVKTEINDMRHKEKYLFENMNYIVSGRGAAAVVRDKQTGNRRDLNQEAKEKKERDDNKADHETKYMQWGRGLKQVTDENQKLQEDIYEMSKPLARYADDEDLDKYLREQVREGDPMLDYIRCKSKAEEGKCKPPYEGSFMPNRFGIRPGYRWDGVDRSNGFEKQWFEEQNSRKAMEEEAYKWSTADM